MAHHHFTRDDRVLLAKLKTSGLSASSCARILGFHVSSVYRELRRGTAQTAIGYDVRVASKHTKQLRTAANQQHRKLHQTQAARITEFIRQYYSPDQAGQAVGLSHATVYRWLWAQPKAFIASMWQFMRHKKLRRKYGTKRRKQQREIQNYAIVDGMLWNFTGSRTERIPLAVLDIPATVRANDIRGVDFHLPGTGEGQ